MLRRWLAALDALDAGRRRPAPGPGEQMLERRVVTLRDRFDVAVGAVAHPSINAEDSRFPLDKPAEADALYTACHDVAMSQSC